MLVRYLCVLHVRFWCLALCVFLFNCLLLFFVSALGSFEKGRSKNSLLLLLLYLFTLVQLTMVSVGSEKPIYASAHVLSVPVLGWGGVRERGRERQKDRERKKTFSQCHSPSVCLLLLQFDRVRDGVLTNRKAETRLSNVSSLASSFRSSSMTTSLFFYASP